MAVREIIEEMAQGGSKIPTYKGGRFKKKEEDKKAKKSFFTQKRTFDIAGWYDYGARPRDLTGLKLNMMMY